MLNSEVYGRKIVPPWFPKLKWRQQEGYSLPPPNEKKKKEEKKVFLLKQLDFSMTDGELQQIKVFWLYGFNEILTE